MKTSEPNPPVPTPVQRQVSQVFEPLPRACPAPIRGVIGADAISNKTKSEYGSNLWHNPVAHCSAEYFVRSGARAVKAERTCTRQRQVPHLDRMQHYDTADRFNELTGIPGYRRVRPRSVRHLGLSTMEKESLNWREHSRSPAPPPPEPESPAKPDRPIASRSDLDVPTVGRNQSGNHKLLDKYKKDYDLANNALDGRQFKNTDVLNLLSEAQYLMWLKNKPKSERISATPKVFLEEVVRASEISVEEDEQTRLLREMYCTREPSWCGLRNSEKSLSVDGRASSSRLSTASVTKMPSTNRDGISSRLWRLAQPRTIHGKYEAERAYWVPPGRKISVFGKMEAMSARTIDDEVHDHSHLGAKMKEMPTIQEGDSFVQSDIQPHDLHAQTETIVPEGYSAHFDFTADRSSVIGQDLDQNQSFSKQSATESVVSRGSGSLSSANGVGTGAKKAASIKSSPRVSAAQSPSKASRNSSRNLEISSIHKHLSVQSIGKNSSVGKTSMSRISHLATPRVVSNARKSAATSKNPSACPSPPSRTSLKTPQVPQQKSSSASQKLSGKRSQQLTPRGAASGTKKQNPAATLGDTAKRLSMGDGEVPGRITEQTPVVNRNPSFSLTPRVQSQRDASIKTGKSSLVSTIARDSGARTTAPNSVTRSTNLRTPSLLRGSINDNLMTPGVGKNSSRISSLKPAKVLGRTKAIDSTGSAISSPVVSGRETGKMSTGMVGSRNSSKNPSSTPAPRKTNVVSAYVPPGSTKKPTTFMNSYVPPGSTKKPAAALMPPTHRGTLMRGSALAF